MKRVVNSARWDEQWFIELSPAHKCLWRYINDTCDYAGFWKVNFTIASFCIGHQFSAADMLVFGKRVMKLNDELYFIRDFFAEQYGVFSDNCRPHTAVKNKLEQYGITMDDVLDLVKQSKIKQQRDDIAPIAETLKSEHIDNPEMVQPDIKARLPVKSKTKRTRNKHPQEETNADYFEDADINTIFNQFLLERKAWKKPATDRAIAMLINTLNKICRGDKNYAIEVIEKSIKSRWTDFYPVKDYERKTIIPETQVQDFING